MALSRVLYAALLSLLLTSPITTLAKTQLVQKPVTRTVPVQRSFIEIKYAIADHYWRHDLAGKRAGWTRIATEATMQNTIVMHVVDKDKNIDRFTISPTDIERIGNQQSIRYKNGSVTTLEWVEEEIDPRFEFPLVSLGELVKWDKRNKVNGLAESYTPLLNKLTPKYAPDDLRLVSYELIKKGFKNKRWRFEFTTKDGKRMGYEVSVTLTSLFSGRFALNYAKQVY